MNKIPWWCIFQRVAAWRAELCTDDSGRESLSKNTVFWGFIISSIIQIKLVIMGGYNETFFGLFLAAFITHGSLTKMMDKKKDTNVSN